jgi:hypothetical protein
LTGETPTKGTGSFWNNPAASDSLIAFGAAMLRAPNFNTGLANGAEAVTKALDPYKMPTQAEIARATLAARLKRYASGADTASHSKGFSNALTAISPNGEMFFGSLNKDTGQPEWYNNKMQRVTELPAGTVPRQDSGYGKQQDLAAKANDTAVDIAMDAPGTLSSINTLQHSYLNAGGGAGAIAAAKRYVGTMMGWSNGFFGDLGDRQTIDAILRKQELDDAKSQRGLGQLTEGERPILRESYANLAQDPDAFWRITEVRKAHAERALAVANSWDDLSNEDKAKYKNDMRRYAVRKWDVENNYQTRLDAIRASKAPAFMTGKPDQETAPAAAPGTAAAPKGLSPNAQKYF